MTSGFRIKKWWRNYNTHKRKSAKPWKLLHVTFVHTDRDYITIFKCGRNTDTFWGHASCVTGSWILLSTTQNYISHWPCNAKYHQHESSNPADGQRFITQYHKQNSGQNLNRVAYLLLIHFSYIKLRRWTKNASRCLLPKFTNDQKTLATQVWVVTLCLVTASYVEICAHSQTNNYAV